MPDIDTLAKKLDARFVLPRPVNEQHISERRALMRVLEDLGKGASYVIAGLVASYFVYLTADALKVSFLSSYGRIALLALFFVWLAVGADVWQLKNDYLRIFQRETFGSARWADLTHLKGKGLVCPTDRSPLPAALPLALFGWRHWFVVPMALVRRN